MFNKLLNNYIHYLSCIIHPWQSNVLGRNLAAQKNTDDDSLTNRLTDQPKNTGHSADTPESTITPPKDPTTNNHHLASHLGPPNQQSTDCNVARDVCRQFQFSRRVVVQRLPVISAVSFSSPNMLWGEVCPRCLPSDSVLLTTPK